MMSFEISDQSMSTPIQNVVDRSFARRIFHGKPPNVQASALPNESIHVKQDEKITQLNGSFRDM